MIIIIIVGARETISKKLEKKLKERKNRRVGMPNGPCSSQNENLMCGNTNVPCSSQGVNNLQGLKFYIGKYILSLV